MPIHFALLALCLLAEPATSAALMLYALTRATGDTHD